MCRMIGRISLVAAPVRYELLDAANSLEHLSRNGCLIAGGTGEHRSGCGIAWIESEQSHPDKMLSERRGSEDCWNQSFIARASQIKTNLLIAHNRKASAGLRTDLNGAHPFLAQLGNREVAFCHNGDADMFMEHARQRGVPDSKLLFEFLLQDATTLSAERISTRLKLLLPGENFSSLSGLLMTDSALCAWRIFAGGKGEHQESRNRYYTLFVKSDEESVTICSEPIDDRGNWRLLDNCELLWIENKNQKLEVKQLHL